MVEGLLGGDKIIRWTVFNSPTPSPYGNSQNEWELGEFSSQIKCALGCISLEHNAVPGAGPLTNSVY